jgi:hypothetical protein
MVVKFKETFSVVKSRPKQAKGKIYLMSCHHSWKQNICLWRAVGICTDGAPSMVVSIRGFASLVTKENPDTVTTHYFIHRELLVSKILGNKIKEILDEATKMVNFIKQRPGHSRMFKKLYENVAKQLWGSPTGRQTTKLLR